MAFLMKAAVLAALRIIAFTSCSESAASIVKDTSTFFNDYEYPTAKDPPQPGFVSPKSKSCNTCPWNSAKNGRFPNPYNVPNTNDSQFEPIHRGNYFDVYGDWIETRYSEVFWTAQPAVPLPLDIVQKFKGRVMSITGFESDVVSGGENSDNPEWSVPEYQVYNHHYIAVINGEGTKMTKIGERNQDSLLMSHDGTRSRTGRHAMEMHPPEWEPRSIDIQGIVPPAANSSTIPTAQLLVQGNGGEHRKSFKHLPRGTGQLIHSPKEFNLHPMLINTNYPPQHPGQTPWEALHDATLPANSQAPPNANYSGLLECPCTTRTHKIITGFVTRSKETCGQNHTLLSPKECFEAANQLMGGNGQTILQNITLEDARYPMGCYLVASSKGTEAYFNTAKESKAHCGAKDGLPVRSMGTAGTTNENGEQIGIHLELNQATELATITLRGPANKWFAIGFNASTMADKPYTIVVHGPNGTVMERILENHLPGIELPSSIQVISNTVDPAPPTPQETPKKMNHLGIPLGGEPNAPTNSWESCRSMCHTTKQCQAWTFVPSTGFNTPYTLQEGSCILRKAVDTSNIPDDASSSSSSSDDEYGFTSEGWIDGMWSGIVVVETKEEDNNMIRTLVLTRPLKGSHYSFDPTVSSIPYIEAVGTGDAGSGTNFGYHGSKGKGGGSIVMVETGAPICICSTDHLSGSINGIPWDDNCAEFPATTIRRDRNPSCFIDTYQGGMTCCHHGVFLLDADQVIPAPTFRFRMKFRFYYEDPEEITAAAAAADGPPPPSISQLVYPGLDYQNTFMFFRETEWVHGEYDVPPCEPGTPVEECVHIIEGKFQVHEGLHKCEDRADMWCAPGLPTSSDSSSFPPTQHIALVHISTHCHGPACISMEMINVDTNETICYTEPYYGGSTKAMDEAGYAVGIPPCIWGTPDEGLPFPPILSMDTNLTIIKKVNSTYGHRGVMAHWQMRAIWAADPKEVNRNDNINNADKQAKVEESNDDEEITRH